MLLRSRRQRLVLTTALASSLSLALATTLPALSADINYSNGAGDNNWFVPGNWAGGATPTAIDRAFLNSSTAGQTAFIGAPGAVGSRLTLQGDANLTVGAGGTLTLAPIGVVGADGALIVGQIEGINPPTTNSTLTIQSGGVVNAARFFVGDGAPSSAQAGIAFVTGAGSSLTINDGAAYGFQVGATGTTSLLRIDSGAVVNAGSAGNLVVQAGNAIFGGSGTIQIGNGGASGTLNASEVQLINASRLVFDHSDNTTFAPVVTGSGALVKQGSGTLTLNAASSYSGATTVDAGTLRGGAANSFSGASATTVDAGATLDLGGFDQAIGSLAGAGAVTLGTATLSSGANNASTTFSGTISGAGTFVKEGTGTLTLSGVNSYSGPTRIQGGTLRMGAPVSLSNQTAVQISAGAVFDLAGSFQTIGSLAGTGDVLLGAAATLVTGNDNSSTTFSGAISGSGSLAKVGSGTMTLTGSNSFTGLTEVIGGSLVVDGSLATPVNVHSGGTLGGSGSVGTTGVAGTLSPGNSPGTLTVNGNLVMGSGSLYLAEVQGAVADRVNVTGTANLAGTLRLVPLGGAYNFSAPYTLLSAAGGLAGTFSPVDTTGTFGDGVTTTVSYTSNDVLLTLTPKPLTPIMPTSPRLNVGRPANAYAVASAIDGAVANGADPSALFGIYNLPAAAIPAAVNSLSGELHAAVPAMAHVASDQFLRVLLDGTRAGRLAGAPGGPGGAAGFTADLPSKQDGPGRPTFDPARFSLWGESFGSTGRTDGDRAVGSANRNLSDAHVAVGADIRLGNNAVVGAAVAGGQARSSLAAGLGKAEADVFQAGLYGRATLGTVNLAAALGYARLDTDTSRAIPALGRTGVAASYTTQAWSGRIEASLPVASFGGLTFSPLAAFQAARADSPAAVERDASGATAGMLTLARRSDMTSRSELGLQLDASLVAGAAPVTGFVRATWAHYYQRDAELAASLNGLPGASFAVTGARPDRNAALLAAGADIRLSQSVSLGMRVDSELSGNTRRLGGTAQLRVSF